MTNWHEHGETNDQWARIVARWSPPERGPDTVDPPLTASRRDEEHSEKRIKAGNRQLLLWVFADHEVSLGTVLDQAAEIGVEAVDVMEVAGAGAADAVARRLFEEVQAPRLLQRH